MIVGRIAVLDHALIAALMALEFLFLGGAHFSGAPWAGPRAVFGGTGASMHAWGVIFTVLAVAIVASMTRPLRRLTRSCLFALGACYGVLGVSFACAGLTPTSSLTLPILSFLAVLSVFHTLLSIDPQSGGRA